MINRNNSKASLSVEPWKETRQKVLRDQVTGSSRENPQMVDSTSSGMGADGPYHHSRRLSIILV